MALQEPSTPVTENISRQHSYSYTVRLVGAALIALVSVLFSYNVICQTLNTSAYASSLKPAIGDPAPNFALQDMHGKTTVRLADLKGQPTVLLFGSYSCSFFSNALPAFEKLYKTHRNAAHIYLVYTREEHPVEETELPANVCANIHVKQAKTLTQRQRTAQMLAQRYHITTPILVDEMDDRVQTAYRGSPMHVYILDANGTVVYHNGDPGDLVNGVLSGMLDRLI